MGWLRLDLVRLPLLGLPAFALNWWLVGAAPSFAEAPVRSALAVAPLLLAAAVLSRLLRRDSRVTLGPGFLVFFLVFCLAFSLLTSTDPLIGRRTLVVPGEEAATGDEQLGTTRRSLRGLNRLGDWHYLFAAPAPPADDLLVLTLPPSPGRLRAELRRDFAGFVNQAIQWQTKGMAFDFFLERSTATDPFLAASLTRARTAGIPVLFGYRPRPTDRGLEPVPLPEGLATALPANRRGHLAGFREADERLRMVPLRLAGTELMPALSLRVAEVLHGGPLAPQPEARLLQFVPPRWEVPAIRFDHEDPAATDWSRMRNRFVFVGTEASYDLRPTPFGSIRGVEIHALAAHDLRSGTWIERLDARFVFPLLFSLCYVVTVLFARGAANRKLWVATLVLTLVSIASAALAMSTARLWVTISYPLLAVWLLTTLLVGLRAVRARRARPGTVVAGAGDPPPLRTGSAETRPGTPREPLLADAHEPQTAPRGAQTGGQPDGQPDAQADEGFDVFLSHNSRDKPQVEALARVLKQRGLKPWLDIWELTPGRDWQYELEQIIRTVKSSAVFVGADGLGPWEIPELRASLSECVRRGLPVIPVLLPGTPKQPELPLFLTQFTWVDLRRGISPQGLDRLQWGITGIKPEPVAR